MAKGFKQIDGTFVDKDGRVVSAISAEEIYAMRRQREALIEATAELIYLRLYGKDGALWSANDSKDVWREKARAAIAKAEGNS